MPKTNKELIEIANDLTNNDLCKLLNLTSNRIMVSIGSYQNHWITIEDIECNTNGTLVQINPADKGIDNTFNLEKHINNISDNVELKKKIKKLEEQIENIKPHTEIDFDEDKMDNMLREQDLDWEFDKPLHKNYTKLYIKKIIHNGDTDNELPPDHTSIDYIYDSDSSDSELF